MTICPRCGRGEKITPHSKHKEEKINRALDLIDTEWRVRLDEAEEDGHESLDFDTQLIAVKNTLETVMVNEFNLGFQQGRVSRENEIMKMLDVLDCRIEYKNWLRKEIRKSAEKPKEMK